MGCDLRCGHVGRGDGEVVWTGIGGIGGLAGLRAGCGLIPGPAVSAGFEDRLFGCFRVVHALGGVEKTRSVSRLPRREGKAAGRMPVVHARAEWTSF